MFVLAHINIGHLIVLYRENLNLTKIKQGILNT